MKNKRRIVIAKEIPVAAAEGIDCGILSPNAPSLELQIATSAFSHRSKVFLAMTELNSYLGAKK